MNVRMLAGLAGCLLLAQNAPAGPSGPAETPDETPNPYAVISDRNVFHLNPLPPAPEPEPPKVELPVVKLTGFLKIGDRVRALFCVLPKDKKDGPFYYNLAENERAGIAESGYLEVRTIHYDKGEVDVINSGTPVTLSFKEDSLVAKSEPPSKNPTQAAPGRVAGQAPPGFGARPGGPPFQNPANKPFPFPERPRRVPAPQ